MKSGLKVKTFRAKSYSEALQQVKDALGPDAVILSSRMVEASAGDSAGEADAAPTVELAAASGDGAAAIMRGVHRLKTRAHPEQQAAERRKNASCPDIIRPYRRRLLEEEVRERLVDQVIEVVSQRVAALGPRGMARAVDFLLTELMERIVLWEERPRTRPSVTVLVGSSGVGKSTLLAKLTVGAALQERQRVGIVSLGRRSAARDVLKMTAGVLECPIVQVDTPVMLNRSLDHLVELDQLFLDVEGINPFDDEAIGRLKAMLAPIEGLEAHLVLNATQRDSDNLRSIHAFSVLPLRSIAFVRLDEASCYGGILNALDGGRLPLSYFGFGRDVPADLERASKERVLDLLLDLSTLAGEGAEAVR